MNILIFIPLYGFFFLLSMLLHELMHIKGFPNFWKKEGIIDVHKWGFTCQDTDNEPTYKNHNWAYHNGGIISGLLCILVGGILITLNEIISGSCLLIAGVTNFLYGIIENGTDIIIWRYAIYLVIPLLAIVIIFGV